MELSPLSLQFTSEAGQVIFRSFPLVFVTRAGCHLCAEVEPVVRRVTARSRAALEVVEIGSDDELLRLYSWRIPVVMTPDGVVLAEGRIDGRSLRRAIRDARRRRRPRRR